MGLYKARFGDFEGSFLELLRCVKRGEIDILRVPLGPLAEGYLCELEGAQKTLGELAVLDDITGQVGALSELARLKAQRLLHEELPPEEEAAPGRDVYSEDGSESGDSVSLELEARLSEYKTFLEAASELRRREEEWAEVYSQPVLPLSEPQVEPDEAGRVTLDDLLSALKEVLSCIPGEEEFPAIPREELSVRERMDEIMSEVERAWPVSFRALLRRPRERVEVIATFLALLELIRLGLISVRQEREFGEIMIYKGGTSPAGEAASV